MVGSVLALVAVLVTVGALVQQVHACLARLDSSRTGSVDVAVCVVLTSLGIAGLASWPPVYVHLDEVLGYPNVARVLSDLASVAGAFAAQAMFLLLLADDVRRRRLGLRVASAAGAATAIAVVFLVGGFRHEGPYALITTYARTSGWGRLYLLVYDGYALGALIDILLLALRYGRLTKAATLRLASHGIAVGSVLGVFCIMLQAVAAVIANISGRGALGDLVAAQWYGTGRVLAVAGGLVLPTAASTMVAHPRCRRQYRALHPLWFALYTVQPDIAFTAPRHPERSGSWAIAGAPHRLYQRVIEIQDGLRRLRPRLDAGVREAAYQRARAGGATECRAYAIGDATMIAHALRAEYAAQRAMARSIEHGGDAGGEDVGERPGIDGAPIGGADLTGAASRLAAASLLLPELMAEVGPTDGE